jgi:predicted permease
MTHLLETTWRDVRYAVRAFRKSPTFTAVALLSLALGIGASTAMFSVIYGVLIAPYPYAQPHEIWAPVVNAKTGRGGHGYTVGELREIRKLPAIGDAMATVYDTVLLAGDRTPENPGGVRLTGNAFNFLGVAPVIGRTIQPSDVRPNGEPERVTVLSHAMWQRLFDGDPNALGQKLVLNGVEHTVIGVMPPRFGWYGNTGLWLPMADDPRDDRQVIVIVRLAPGAGPVVAEQQLHALHLRLASERPATFPKDGFTTQLRNYMDVTVASGEMKSGLQMLFAAVGFLLLIACANVANLQLARTTARAREIAVRMSIGAGRGRVLRQLLSESVLLSVSGGALGIWLAVGAIRVIVALMPEFYVPNEARITVNLYVLVFSFVVSVLTGILFGLTPALQCSRPDLAEALKDGTRGLDAGASGRHARNALVVAGVALSVVLLVGAGLAIRSFASLLRVDLGFQPERALTVNVPLPPKKYATLEARNAFALALLDRVRSLPGVEAATIGNGLLPLFGGPQSGYSIEGRPRAEADRVGIALISGDYGRALGIPLLRGRALSDQEILRADRVALINEAAAQLWPGVDPVGRTVRLDMLDRPGGANLLVAPGGPRPVTVVGILRNTRNAGLRTPTAPMAFLPFTLVAPSGRNLVVRTQGPPMALINALRQEVLAIDKEQPLARPFTLEEMVGFQTVQPRFLMALLGAFALLGLALAAAGIYSVISYHVTRRTHEIGIRVALGAERGDVLRMVLGMGARLVAIGLVAGLAASFVLVRLGRAQIFEAASMDAVSSGGVVLVLGAVALAACYVPARRAARMDPMAALRRD